MSGFSAQPQHDAAREETTMCKRLRPNHNSALKAKVAVAAIKGEKTPSTTPVARIHRLTGKPPIGLIHHATVLGDSGIT